VLWRGPQPVFSTKFQVYGPVSTQSKCVYASLVPLPCSAHIAEFLLCELHHHQSRTLCFRLHPSGLWIGGNMRLLDCGCVNTAQAKFVMASRVCSIALSYWSKISVRFLWGQTVLKYCPSFVSILKWALELIISPCSIFIHKNHSFTVPDDSDRGLVRWWRDFWIFSAR
jgi:hypothetical protein